MYFQLYFCTFSGESKCGLVLCEKLFKLFGEESIQATYTFQIPIPEYIINRKVLRHVNPGETPEEIQDRKYNSIFIPPYDDPEFLHKCVEECIQPIRAGVEKLAKYLVHSINIDTQEDSWAFLFIYKGDEEFNEDNPGFGKILLPEGRICYQQEILIIFFIHTFINMFPSGMLFEANGKKEAGILMHTWNEAVFRKRHENKENKDAWRDAWDSWYRNWENRLQKCADLWDASKSDQQKDLKSGRKEWIECLNFWEGVRRQLEEESDEEEESSSERGEFGSKGAAESEPEKRSTEELTSEGDGESEEEETSEEIMSEATGESEGFTSRGETSTSESAQSDTHSSEYSETMAGDISSTEHKSEETESNNDATEGAEESEKGISQNKRRQREGTVDIHSSKRLRRDKDFTTEGET